MRVQFCFILHHQVWEILFHVGNIEYVDYSAANSLGENDFCTASTHPLAHLSAFWLNIEPTIFKKKLTAHLRNKHAYNFNVVNQEIIK